MTVEVEVEVTEQLGPETYAYVRLKELAAAEVGDRPLELAGAFAARLDPRSAAAPGQRLILAVDVAGIKLFDRDTGTNLECHGEGAT